MQVDAPWLHDPPPHGDRLVGYVVVHGARYWTGDPDAPWTLNPRRALVDIAPWDLSSMHRRVGAHCVKVLLENESTMLPLRHW